MKKECRNMSTYRFTRANVEDTVNRVYDYIVEYIRREGYPPAVRDICSGVGIRSTSTIHGHLKRLQQAGRIEYTAGKRRAITIPDDSAYSPFPPGFFQRKWMFLPSEFALKACETQPSLTATSSLFANKTRPIWVILLLR